MTSVKGRPAIHMIWAVPKDMEKEMDAFWAEHEAWMRKSHSVEKKEEGKPCILHYHIAKGPQVKDPMADKPEETGNLLYIMSETYLNGDEIKAHLDLCGKEMSDWMGRMQGYAGKYALLMDIGSTANFTSLQDNQPASIYEKGDACIHMLWKVPGEKKKEMAEFWTKHQEWMRKSHVMERKANSDKKPRVTSFNIRCGQEQNDPMDPSKGKTGQMLIIMSESYASPEDIGLHMETCAKDIPDWMGQMQKYAGEYGQHMDAGQTKVLCTM